MAEAAGLFATSITIAGLVKVCLGAFDLIRLAKSQGLEFEKLVLRLNIERARLYVWSQATGLIGTEDESAKNLLSSSPFEALAKDTLRILLQLFNDGEKLRTKYGCKKSRKQKRSAGGKDAGRSTIKSDPVQHFAATFDHFKAYYDHPKGKEPKILSTTKWIIRDRDQFGVLVREIRDLVNGLQHITESVSAADRQERIMRRNVNQIQDPDTLSLVSEVCQRDHPEISDTASIRAEILSQAASNHPDSDDSDSLTIMTLSSESTLSSDDDTIIDPAKLDISQLRRLVVRLQGLVGRLRKETRTSYLERQRNLRDQEDERRYIEEERKFMSRELRLSRAEGMLEGMSIGYKEQPKAQAKTQRPPVPHHKSSATFVVDPWGTIHQRTSDGQVFTQ